jgi:hypothetical protein
MGNKEKFYNTILRKWRQNNCNNERHKWVTKIGSWSSGITSPEGHLVKHSCFWGYDCLYCKKEKYIIRFNY